MVVGCAWTCLANGLPVADVKNVPVPGSQICSSQIWAYWARMSHRLAWNGTSRSRLNLGWRIVTSPLAKPTLVRATCRAWLTRIPVAANSLISASNVAACNRDRKPRAASRSSPISVSE